MLKLLIFLFSISIVSQNVQSMGFDFLKAIEHNIDTNVDPCDDFYRHSCDINKPVNETIKILATKMYLEVIKNITLTDEFEYGNKLEANDSSIILLKVLLDKNQTENIETLSMFYTGNCLNKNKQAIKFILQALQNSFPTMKFTNLIYDTNCRRSSGQLRKKLEKVWYDEIQSSKVNFSLPVKTAFIRSHAWMSINEDLFDKHRDYMEEFKAEIESLMKITPWVKQSDTENFFKKLLDSTFFEMGPSYQREMGKFEFLNLLLAKCRSPAYLNAFNAQPDIVFHHSLMYVFSMSPHPGLLYGASGSTMAHELGHSFIKGQKDFLFVPYSPKAYKSCVQEQFTSTCSIFKEKECETGDHQFDENGSDIFGLKLAFDLMKKKFGDKMNEVLEGSRYNLTNAEVFFYAANIFDCSREQSASLPTDSHHASNARINAASVQVPEFQQIFGCDNNSRMMRSKTKQCILFGADASD
ncbi:unnamed protein product [Caenorhabditis angaria]|uniref:Peptidase M13 C-terminal domain-containing protein n=1 Tax=Caenorhabditis angaria TaxID=860376 RepID=A0A9P1J147_9PELO|nr:unnamed protein product [Caenorhabditis angaria]